MYFSFKKKKKSRSSLTKKIILPLCGQTDELHLKVSLFFFTRMKTWWDPCSFLKMWFREAPPEEEKNKTESGKRNAKGILYLNIYLLYFTELSSGGIWWPERNGSLWDLFCSLYSNLLKYSVLFLAGVLRNCQPIIHFDPATEDNICLKCLVHFMTGGDDQHPSSLRKKKPLSNVFHVLDPRAQGSTFGVLELHPGGTTASFAWFLCQKSLHEKKNSWCVPYELLENNAGLQNI